MDDYIGILQHIIKISEDELLFKNFITKEKVAMGSNGKVVDKIYRRL